MRVTEIKWLLHIHTHKDTDTDTATARATDTDTDTWAHKCVCLPLLHYDGVVRSIKFPFVALALRLLYCSP